MEVGRSRGGKGLQFDRRKITWNPRKRLEASLQHKEPDRIPFDLGSTLVTNISVTAYKNLLAKIGITSRSIELCDVIQQLPVLNSSFLRRFKVDTRGVFPIQSLKQLKIKETREYKYFTDEWGIKWRMPKERGYYFDICEHPLEGVMTKRDIDRHPFPFLPTKDDLRIPREKAKSYFEKENFALVLGRKGAGFFGMSMQLRGFENFLADLAIDPSLACYLMDKILDWRMRYWESVLREVGEYFIVVYEGDDLGQQNGLLISPAMYREYIKPRQKKLFSFIKSKAPKKIYLFYHSDGSIYDVIPDLIEIGIDILNPVQVSATKMETLKLKREFGKDITFWGGGIDSQRILPTGSPQEVRQEVKRRIDHLAPGGGFVFAPIHNIQPDVPPENIVAMWEALQEYGKYS